MAEKTKTKSRYVDDAGIRLAPTPLHDENTMVMPKLKQEYVISPQLVVDRPDKDSQPAELSTEHDYQPKKKDVSKKWKRRRRGKNMALGAIMLVASLIVLLPYVLGAAGVFPADEKFVFVPKELGAIRNFISAITSSVKGGTPDDVKTAWLHCVPSLMLLLGLIFVLINVVRSIVGLFGAIKPKRYVVCALIYLLMAVAVLILYLVGAPSIDIKAQDFVNDVIKGYQNSEIFGILVFSLGYFLISTVCSLIGADKYGYLR